MKKIFTLSLLLCAAVTGVSAEDSFTWKNSATAITAESWAVADNWTLSGSTTFPTGGPAITGDHAWDKMYFTNASGTTENLEGWAFKIEMDNSTITIPNIKKLQGTCSITLKNSSTLNMTKAVSASGNDGHPVAVDLATGDGNVFNLIMGNNKGGELTTVNYGTLSTTTNRKFNISSNNATSRTYNLLKVVATITDEVESTVEPTLHSVELGTLTNVTIASLTSEITAEGYVKSEGALTATEGNVGTYSVDASSGTIVLYWVTGTLAGEDVVIEEGQSKTLTELVTEYGVPNTITVKNGATLDLNETFNLNKVTTEAGSTLVLSTAADLSAVTGATNVVINTNYTIDGNKSTSATGKLTINAGKQLTIGGGDSQTNSVASFTSVLINGTLYGNNKTTTLNNVTFGDGGVLHSFDMGAPGSNAANGTYENSFHLVGTTTVDGEAFVLTNWNAQYTIDKLVGSGTVRLRGNGKTNESASEDTYYTISNTEEFTGKFDILNTQATIQPLTNISITNAIKVKTATFNNVTIEGAERINTSGNVTINGVASNNLTSSTNGYTFVGAGTLNLNGDIDLTKDGTNSNHRIGYGAGANVNILSGANVTLSCVYNSSTASSNPNLTIESDATLTTTLGSVCPVLANNGTIGLANLNTAKYTASTVNGDSFNVAVAEDVLAGMSNDSYNIVTGIENNSVTAYTLNGNENVMVNGYSYSVCAENNNIVLKRVRLSYDATITAGHNGNFGTLCLPYATIVPESVNAFTLTSLENDRISFTKAYAAGSTLPANEPVLIAGENAGSFTFLGTADADKVGSNIFLGTPNAEQVDMSGNDIYVLAMDGSDICFMKTSAANVNANKAYIKTSVSLSAKAITVDFDGTTGINNAIGINVDSIFDLTGRKVNNVGNGFYIINGKKVVR